MNDRKQEEIRAAFRERFKQRDRDDWVAELAPNTTCVAPVYTIPELVDDPHLQERQSFMQAEHPEEGPFKQVGPILAGGVREQAVHRVPDPDATETQAILENAGIGADEVQQLIASGAVE